MRSASSVPRKNVERETKAFSQDEAKTILAAALTCGDRKSFDERARRWVPWICAYSGARAGEITQLRGIVLDAILRITGEALEAIVDRVATRCGIDISTYMIERAYEL